MKKITMRDVAKAAGVSVATVSYVLNNKDKESIHENTRKRVLGAVEELNYIPDLTARALTRKKSSLIGIFLMNDHQELLPWRKSFYSEFISELIKVLYRLEYHVIVEHIDASNEKLNIIYERALDGAFLLDISDKYLYDTTKMFKIPIILIDTYIEDTIFHKVLSDYGEAIDKGKEVLKENKPFIVADSINSKLLIEKLSGYSKFDERDIYVMDNKSNLYKFLEDNKGRKGIIFNEFLAILARSYILPENIIAICSSGNEYLLDTYKYKLSFNNKEKASLAADIMIDYINKNYHNDKFSLIKPDLI